MELLPLVCLCLLSCSGDARVKVFVKEGSDAVLPCLISTEDLEGKLFDWRKVESQTKKEVFIYEAGSHYNNGRTGQNEQFKGRVSHFQDQLQNGNASIKITRTKMADSGTYSCDFPRLQPRQTSIIELVVDPVLRDRINESIPGAASEPSVSTLLTPEGTVLQCKVRDASPKPKVEWKDSSGNILPVKDLKETESGGSYDIILQAAVTKSDNFRCVVTQEEIGHQTEAETYASVNGAAPEPGWSGWWVAGFIVVSLFLVGGVVFHFKDRIRQIYVECVKKNNVKEPDPEAESLKQHDSKSEKKSDGEKTDPAAKPLNPPEKNPGSTPNAANGQPDTEENTAV